MLVALRHSSIVLIPWVYERRDRIEGAWIWVLAMPGRERFGMGKTSQQIKDRRLLTSAWEQGKLKKRCGTVKD